MHDLLKLEGSSLKTALLVIAMSAVLDAGYRKVARSTLAQKKQAEYLLGLPRIQQAISISYDNNGLSLENCAQILSDIAHGRVEDATVGDRLRALDMRFKTSTGFATSKSATINAQVAPDQFFDAETFAHAPPINVTPGDDDDEGDE